MNVRISLLSLALVALILSTDACSCIFTDLPNTYHSSFTKRFVKATPVQTFVHSNQRFYLLQIEREYKACPKQLTTVLASTALNSAACGRPLTLHTPYIMPLDNVGFFVSINSCQVSSHPPNNFYRSCFRLLRTLLTNFYETFSLFYSTSENSRALARLTWRSLTLDRSVARVVANVRTGSNP